MNIKPGDEVKIRHKEKGKVKSIQKDGTVWITLRDGVTVCVRKDWLKKEEADE